MNFYFKKGQPFKSFGYKEKAVEDGGMVGWDSDIYLGQVSAAEPGKTLLQWIIGAKSMKWCS